LNFVEAAAKLKKRTWVIKVSKGTKTWDRFLSSINKKKKMEQVAIPP
jgi:hypothetical protein